MADRPVPDPNEQPTPDAQEGSPPAPTEPLPPTPPAPSAQPGPATAPSQPAWTAGSAAPQGPPPAWSGTARPPGGPSAPRRLWNEATATTGSRIALAAAAVLGVVVLLAGIGLVGSFVVHGIDRAGLVLDDDDRHDRFDDDDARRGGDTPFGNNGRGHGNGNGRADGQGGPGRDATGRVPGQGRSPGGADGSVPGLGTVLHGQFTTTLTGEPAVMLFQVGEVTAATEGESLTVRSTDGFEATYVLDASTSGAATPATGDRVRVVAAEDGMAVVFVQVLGADD